MIRVSEEALEVVVKLNKYQRENNHKAKSYLSLQSNTNKQTNKQTNNNIIISRLDRNLHENKPISSQPFIQSSLGEKMKSL